MVVWYVDDTVAGVNDRLAVWRHSNVSCNICLYFVAGVNDRLAVWRHNRGGDPELFRVLQE